MTLRGPIACCALSTLVIAVTAVQAQEYPNRPVRLVTGAVGGGSDFVARLVAPGIQDGMGQPVIVENRAAVTAIETVAKAPPDGYTALVFGNGFWLGPLLNPTSYDPIRDFAPVTMADSSPNVLVVHPSLPAKTVRDLISLAKARPGQLNYASTITGGISHLAGELFAQMAGVRIVRVPYKGGGPAVNDLVGGQVQMLIGSAGSVVPFVKAGRLRALAVTSLEPSPLVPGLPALAGAGLPGYEAVATTGIFAPAKTPPAAIQRLNREMARYLKSAEAKERFLKAGSESVGSTPEEFAAAMKAEMSRMGKVIRDAGIRAD